MRLISNVRQKIMSPGKKNMLEMNISHEKCAYCRDHINNASATKDHIIPKSAPHNGAKLDYRNIVWSCGTCNNVMKKNRVFLKRTRKTNIGSASAPEFVIEQPIARRHYLNGVAGVIMQERRKIDPVD